MTNISFRTSILLVLLGLIIAYVGYDLLAPDSENRPSGVNSAELSSTRETADLLKSQAEFVSNGRNVVGKREGSLDLQSAEHFEENQDWSDPESWESSPDRAAEIFAELESADLPAPSLEPDEDELENPQLYEDLQEIGEQEAIDMFSSEESELDTQEPESADPEMAEPEPGYLEIPPVL